MQQGTDVAALPGATAFGDTPPSTPEMVSFIMRERNLPQLKAAVQGGVTNFLSVGRFAATYGQNQASIAQLTGYLAKFGISTQVYADNIDVVANGTAGEFDKALDGPPATGRACSRARRSRVPPGRFQRRPCTPPPRLRCCQPAACATTSPPSSVCRTTRPFASQAQHVKASVAEPQPNSGNSCVKLTGLAIGLQHAARPSPSNYGLTPLVPRLATPGPGTDNRPSSPWPRLIRVRRSSSGRTCWA